MAKHFRFLYSTLYWHSIENIFTCICLTYRTLGVFGVAEGEDPVGEGLGPQKEASNVEKSGQKSQSPKISDPVWLPGRQVVCKLLPFCKRHSGQTLPLSTYRQTLWPLYFTCLRSNGLNWPQTPIITAVQQFSTQFTDSPYRLYVADFRSVNGIRYRLGSSIQCIRYYSPDS